MVLRHTEVVSDGVQPRHDVPAYHHTVVAEDTLNVVVEDIHGIGPLLRLLPVRYLDAHASGVDSSGVDFRLCCVEECEVFRAFLVGKGITLPLQFGQTSKVSCAHGSYLSMLPP